MANSTKAFRRQHNEIVDLVQQILSMLKTEDLRRNADPVCNVRSRLAGVLVVHLAMEDRVMYPQLIASANAGLAAMAQRYQSEVGDYKVQFDAYLQRWRTAEDVQADPPSFIRETSRILGALVQRIERENSELYPLVETAQPPRLAKTG
jgi:hypothetical protein